MVVFFEKYLSFLLMKQERPDLTKLILHTNHRFTDGMKFGLLIWTVSCFDLKDVFTVFIDEC